MSARYVVAGCARSATTYTAYLLTAAGLDCRHEHAPVPAGDDYVLPPALGEASCYVAPFLPQAVVTVHQIRPPLDVIASLAGRGMLEGAVPEWQRFTRAHAPSLFNYPPGAQRAAAYWLKWNRLIEPHADLTWRTPSLTPGSIADLAERAGLEVDPQRVDWALARTSQRTNTRQHRQVTLADLGELAGPVAHAADRYGVPLTFTPPTAPRKAAMETETYRNLRTGLSWTVDVGSPEHKRMSGSEEFELLPAKKRAPAKKQSPEPKPELDGLAEFAPREGDEP